MDQAVFEADCKARLAADIRNMPDARDELAKILDAEAEGSAHPMTNVLDMLAGIAEERSQMEGDRWEQIAQLVQKCASACEHRTQEPQYTDAPAPPSP